MSGRCVRRQASRLAGLRRQLTAGVPTGGAALALVLLLVSAGCGGPGADPRALTVFAAISLTEPLEQLAERFKAQTGVMVTLNLSGSNTLATQILAGGPADLFLSADAAQMDRIRTAGLVDETANRRLLSNRLVVIVPTASTLPFQVPADLAAPAVKRFAIGDPAAVPAGKYAEAYLQSRGIWPALEPRLVYFPHVRATMAAVEQGAADAGIVYRTDAKASQGARVLLEIDEDPRWAIVYPAAILRSAPHAETARKFFAWLQQPDNLRVFGDSGFIVLPAGSS